MKTSKLSNFEIDMIRLIARYYPYREDTVEKVYRIQDSYDKTIAALEWATANAEYPQDYSLNQNERI